MQKLGKFNLKVNVIPNRLEKYMSFNINSKLSFIESFQFLCSSLDRLVKNVSNDDFKYLSQEIHNEVLHLVKMDFILLSNEHVLKVWNKFEMKAMKDYHGLYLECDVLLLADVFKKLEITS